MGEETSRKPWKEVYYLSISRVNSIQIKMPFKPPEVSRCPTCDRPVYAAEEKLAGGYKWHKVCFKCNVCSKFLDSTTCAEHERNFTAKLAMDVNMDLKESGLEEELVH